MAVDLGINTPATCCLLDTAGTVLGREFISFPSEKARIDTIAGRIKKTISQSGPKAPVKLRTKEAGLRLDYERRSANAITMLAVYWKADIVVFENLDGFNRPMKKGEAVQMWSKRYIQDLCRGMLHRYGIRYTTVNAAYTSRLAFDGSGKVTRDKKNYSLCTFTTGKQYNCDLSASYNIGSRYMQRELLKALPEKAGCTLKAKVPGLCKRTTCTLASYRLLRQEVLSLAV